ncbi:hypothetical protein Hamer_G023858, partial [Homarus americanus]
PPTTTTTTTTTTTPTPTTTSAPEELEDEVEEDYDEEEEGLEVDDNDNDDFEIEEETKGAKPHVAESGKEATPGTCTSCRILSVWRSDRHGVQLNVHLATSSSPLLLATMKEVRCMSPVYSRAPPCSLLVNSQCWKGAPDELYCRRLCVIRRYLDNDRIKERLRCAD